MDNVHDNASRVVIYHNSVDIRERGVLMRSAYYLGRHWRRFTSAHPQVIGAGHLTLAGYAYTQTSFLPAVGTYLGSSAVDALFRAFGVSLAPIEERLSFTDAQGSILGRVGGIVVIIEDEVLQRTRQGLGSTSSEFKEKYKFIVSKALEEARQGEFPRITSEQFEIRSPEFFSIIFKLITCELFVDSLDLEPIIQHFSELSSDTVADLKSRIAALTPQQLSDLKDCLAETKQLEEFPVVLRGLSRDLTEFAYRYIMRDQTTTSMLR